jgi:hypothetical protein
MLTQHVLQLQSKIWTETFGSGICGRDCVMYRMA